MGIIHHSTKGHGQGIAQLSALMNCTGGLGVDVTGFASQLTACPGSDQGITPGKAGRRTEFRDKLVKALTIPSVLRVEFLQRAFQP